MTSLKSIQSSVKLGNFTIWKKKIKKFWTNMHLNSQNALNLKIYCLMQLMSAGKTWSNDKLKLKKVHTNISKSVRSSIWASVAKCLWMLSALKKSFWFNYLKDCLVTNGKKIRCRKTFCPCTILWFHNKLLDQEMRMKSSEQAVLWQILSRTLLNRRINTTGPKLEHFLTRKKTQYKRELS
jgi:hypothetical protein